MEIRASKSSPLCINKNFLAKSSFFQPFNTLFFLPLNASSDTPLSLSFFLQSCLFPQLIFLYFLFWIFFAKILSFSHSPLSIFSQTMIMCTCSMPEKSSCCYYYLKKQFCIIYHFSPPPVFQILPRISCHLFCSLSFLPIPPKLLSLLFPLPLFQTICW